MKLGFFSAILPDLTFQQVIDFAAAGDFACVEMGCWPVDKADRKFAGIKHIDVESLSSARADAIQATCAKQNVSISALGYYPNVLDADPAISARRSSISPR